MKSHYLEITQISVVILKILEVYELKTELVISTSHLKIGDLECEGEVGGDGEDNLLLEWYLDLDLLSIHSSGPSF